MRKYPSEADSDWRADNFVTSGNGAEAAKATLHRHYLSFCTDHYRAEQLSPLKKAKLLWPRTAGCFRLGLFSLCCSVHLHVTCFAAARSDTIETQTSVWTHKTLSLKWTFFFDRCAFLLQQFSQLLISGVDFNPVHYLSSAHKTARDLSLYARVMSLGIFRS